MPRPSSKFVCQQCGAETVSWFGRCPNCSAWNSLVEAPVELSPAAAKKGRARGKKLEAIKLSAVKAGFNRRVSTKIGELDRVLGGGIVTGSVILLSGDPGIGKSTLLLQVAEKVSGEVLYISGEESPEQVRIRAKRLNLSLDSLNFLTETNIENLLETLADKDFSLVIVDSIQTMWTQNLTGTPGSVGQVRESAGRLLSWAKSSGTPLFLVGHVTKEGAIAGPMVLAHLVDTVLFLEGERFSTLRLLRSFKNRFGPTDEVGVFEMTKKGMEEVTNPSRLFLKKRVKRVPGSVVVVTMEGTRPVLAEIQALVAPTQLAIPRRIGQGIDYRRLQMLSAVLARRLGLPLATFDIYVNVAGGLRISEPAADLGIALAIISSLKNTPLSPKLACFGEIGLLGELRTVSQADKRRKEARRLGFTTIVSPENFFSINSVVKKNLTK